MSTIMILILVRVFILKFPDIFTDIENNNLWCTNYGQLSVFWNVDEGRSVLRSVLLKYPKIIIFVRYKAIFLIVIQMNIKKIATYLD